MDYLYDGSFNGLLTCLYEHYYSQKAENIFEASRYQISMVNQSQTIDPDDVKAKKVSLAIERLISKTALRYIYHVSLSNDINKGKIILDFVKFGFIEKKDITVFFEHPFVHPVCMLHKQVTVEVHRFLGLLRFVELDGVLFAKYKPDHNITEIIVRHFSDRLKNERFIIFDEGRKLAALYYEGSTVIADFDEVNFDTDSAEDNIRKLWKSYFKHISIKERENLKAQYQHVPVRYRRNAVEFNQ
ncbi:MAG: TIGR03915 family putative DNA repair protein [Eubacteriales bacterium]|nr:TIGR03915 family putative DNA repair protein [Eubacteriales bacterium]